MGHVLASKDLGIKLHEELTRLAKASTGNQQTR
jgi:hypothetical protein